MNAIDEIQKANEERKGNILKSFGIEGETIEKAKYIRRTGSPGNYKYEYPDDKKEGVWTKEQENAVSENDKAFKEHLKKKNIDPYSKEAADEWKNAGFMDKQKKIFGKDDDKKDNKSKEGYDSTFELNGKTYKTKGFTSVDAANNFMEKNPDYGLIGIKKQQVLGKTEEFYHVAKNDDMGKGKNDKKLPKVGQVVDIEGKGKMEVRRVSDSEIVLAKEGEKNASLSMSHNMYLKKTK
jgi:hypothetical protein